MRMNQERTKTLTNDLRRIRPQMDQTVEDWNSELMSFSCTERRLSILRRYREQVLWFNQEEINKYHLPLDSAIGGLGLSDRLTTDPYVNGFRRYLIKNKPVSVLKTEIPVEEIFPQVLGPWKIKMLEDSGEDLDTLHNEYRSSSDRKYNPKSTQFFHLTGIVNRMKKVIGEKFCSLKGEYIFSERCVTRIERVLGEGCFHESKEHLYRM